MAWIRLLIGAGGGALLTLLILNLTTSEKKVAAEIKLPFGIGDPRFRRLVSYLLGPPLVDGNRIRALQNGDEIFSAMLAAIRGAKRSVCFETYIYWSGAIGRKFSEALSARARAGIPVHVILDGVGCGRLDKESIEMMRDAGAQIERYHQATWKTISNFNNRTHRKILVVDGTIGFTGGVGIADKWRGDAEDADHWRDVHFEVHGPVVAQMQAAFMDNWLKTKAEVLHGDAYFPSLKSVGDQPMQLFKSSPDEGSESVRLMYLLSIAAAQRSIFLGISYFVPDDLAVTMLCAAAQRGVHIKIIVPGEHIDAKVTRRASRARWGPLLDAGIEIHEFQPTMYHCKVMVVDEQWVSVGSTNFDSRSFRLNAEANLNVYDKVFAAEQIKSFNADLLLAKKITRKMWKRRPLRERAVECYASVVRSQL